MSNIYAIILAGGKGSRMGRILPKQFLNLNNRPIIVWSLEKFNNLSQINGIIIVIHEEYIQDVNELVSKHNISKTVKIVPGGSTRQLSSYNALSAIEYNTDDILIFHDAARPFIKKDIILNCINETKVYGASGVYIRTVDTIAEIYDDFVGSILERNRLYCTQTPQVFRYSVIRKAHETALLKNVTNSTDDVQMVISAGNRVRIVEGDSSNIKITTKFDLEFAEFLAARIESKGID